jgi:hypothetical protein
MKGNKEPLVNWREIVAHNPIILMHRANSSQFNHKRKMTFLRMQHVLLKTVQDSILTKKGLSLKI